MTAKDLYNFLGQVICDGYGNSEILFDTDARTFNYHMAKVGSAYLCTEFDPDRPFISLHEVKHEPRS